MRKLFVSNDDKSIRMFDNNVLDFMSRTSWYIPLLFWGPILFFLAWYNFNTFQFSKVEIICCIGLSILFWSFTEYILHRFIFHYQPNSNWGKRIHFLAHGVHHDYPNDSKRLVLPPAMSLLLSLPFFGLFYMTLGKYYLLFFIVFMIGYLFYDTLHYALHHSGSTNSYFKKMKEQHMLHHYNDNDAGFGVTSEIWDQVFGTRLSKK